MKPDDRRTCVEALADLQPRPHTPLDLEAASTFLPLASTRRAFASEASVVLGGRGTGKTAIFKVMIDHERRGDILSALNLDLSGSIWLRLYSGGGPGEPEVNLLESLADLNDLDLRAMWTALLAASIAASQPATPLPEPLHWLHGLPVNSPRAWILQARASFGALITALDDFEVALGARGQTIYCCYDALDRISPFNQNQRRRHIRAILALWTSLAGRLRRIRPKIFLRSDLADADEIAFADASKLLSRAASLEWSHEELFRLLVRYLARSDVMRQWLGRVKGLTLQSDPHLGWLPGPMREVVRDAFTHRLVGATIGNGIFQTESGRWIIARMADARGEITPRTMLSFYGAAGAARLSRISELDGRSVRLLDVQDLKDALRSTSSGRVTELREDYPIVNRLLNLTHERVRLPLPKSRAIEFFSTPSDAERDQRATDGAQVLDELIRLGAVSVHRLSATEDYIDIPDIYRIGFGIDIDIDYHGALGAYLAHGETLYLQREDLHQLEDILGNLMKHEDYQRFLALAQAALSRGETSTALAVFEQILEVAESGQNVTWQIVALIDIGNSWILHDPPFALRYLAVARALLDSSPSISERSLLRERLDIVECLAHVAIGDVKSAHRLIEPSVAKSPEGRDRESEDMFADDRSWAMAQVSLREGQWRAALSAADDLLHPEHTSRAGAWRGYLVLASLTLLVDVDSPKIRRGMLPWSIDLATIPSERHRDAALLSLLTFARGQVLNEQSIAALDATARHFLGDSKADLTALRTEAAEQGSQLVERVRAKVAARTAPSSKADKSGDSRFA